MSVNYIHAFYENIYNVVEREEIVPMCTTIRQTVTGGDTYVYASPRTPAFCTPSIYGCFAVYAYSRTPAFCTHGNGSGILTSFWSTTPYNRGSQSN